MRDVDEDEDGEHGPGEREDHEARMEYWTLQRSFPAGRIPDGALEQARFEWASLQRTVSFLPLPVNPPGNGIDWKQVGPAPLDTSLSPLPWGPVAGRMTDLKIVPGNAKVLYAGFAQGGVWKSVDSGQTFTPISDTLPSLAVGSIAIDPANTDTLYLGTGEGNQSADSYFGQGLYKSTDGGAHWFLLAGGKFTGSSIPKVWVDPLNGNVYLAAAAGVAGVGLCTNWYPNGADNGLWKSTDGGNTWSRLASGSVLDFEVDVGLSPRKIYYYVDGTGPLSLVEGNAAVAIAGLPTAKSNPAVNRMRFAIAPSNRLVIFVGTGFTNNTSTVYRSVDGGANWVNLVSPNYCGGQCWYDNVVTVHPTDPNIVYLGGGMCASWKSSNALGNGTFASMGVANCGNNNWFNSTIHSDTHAIVVEPGAPNRVWVGTDGGLNLSTDSGATFSRLNSSFATTQFYTLCTHPTDPDIVGGGMQDNSVGIRRAGSVTWDAPWTGDGAGCAINGNNPDQVMMSAQYASVARFTNNLSRSSLVFDASPGCGFGMPGCGDRVSFIPPMTRDYLNGATVYVGTHRLWRTTDFGTTWSAVTGDVTSGVGGISCSAGGSSSDYITAIATAPSDSNTVYTGSGGGRVWGSVQGAAWARLDKLPLPRRWVSGVSVDATDPKRIYAAYSGFNSATPQQPGHVFRSDDGGATWVSADIGADIPVNAILADPFTAGVVYAGTDYGVLWSTDAGKSWGPLGTTLPSVAVYALQMNKVGRLFAATHGRSVWMVPMYLDLGASCNSGAQCFSGQCVDGVCCESACTGQCSACNLKGTEGRCKPVKGPPVAPRLACVSDGSACGGSCDGVSPVCTYPSMNVECKPASCANGIGTPARSCDGKGACPPQMSAPCAPFLCGMNACLTSCSDDKDCVAGNYCTGMGGSCLARKGPGKVCQSARECLSGFCADGLCCNEACTEQCAACNRLGLEGTCVTVTGPPVAPRPACASDGSACGGRCDGQGRAACAYPGQLTSCREAACANGVATLGAACDGKGACPPVMQVMCGRFLCGPVACLATCKSDGDCVMGSYCDAGGCKEKKAAAAPCTTDHECGSGFCADGVCCESACKEQCVACNQKGSEGRCTVVTGAPSPGHPACAGAGTPCGGSCDGMKRDTCTYPDAKVECAPLRCDDKGVHERDLCDGKGACTPGMITPCPGGCDGTKCAPPPDLYGLPDLTPPIDLNAQDQSSIGGNPSKGCGCDLGGGRAEAEQRGRHGAPRRDGAPLLASLLFVALLVRRRR